MGFGPLYSKSQISSSRKSSQAIKDILKKPGVGKIINDYAEMDELHNALSKEAAGRGLTRDGLRRVLGDFISKGGKQISKDEGRKLANALAQGAGVKAYLLRKETPTKKPPTELIQPVYSNQSSQIKQQPNKIDQAKNSFQGRGMVMKMNNQKFGSTYSKLTPGATNRPTFH